MKEFVILQSRPWLPYIVTNLIKLFRPREVFEWGSGNSTLFFSRLGLYRLVSIEHDVEWYEKIEADLPGWVDYQFIPGEDGEIGPDKANPEHYKSGSTIIGAVNFKKYASAIDRYGLFDLILIDGVVRPSCMVHAINHVRDGGWLVLDNTGDRPYYLEKTGELFGNYETGWERIRLMGYGPILAYQWETTIFINRRKDFYTEAR